MSVSRRTSFAAAGLLLVFGAATLAWRYASGVAEPPTPAPAAVPASVASVLTKSVPVRIYAIGNVEPLTSVAVKARVDGQIVAVRFAAGDEVKQGQVLFEIDRRPFEAQLRQAQANALKDQALYDHALEQQKRYKDLLDRKFISADAFEQVKTNVDTAQATLNADEAAMQSVRLQIDYCTIRSPLTGYAGTIMIQRGNLVKANDTVSLVVLNQVQPINVSFSVPEQRLADVRHYDQDGELKVSVQIKGAASRPIAGKLSFIDNSTDISTGTIRLRAQFANADKTLWPGQFVNVVLDLTSQRDAIVVPTTAIQNGPNGQYVFVVKADQTVELRDVRIERTEGDDTVVESGLTPGETVVTRGQLRLAPGIRIAAEPKAAAEPKGAGAL